MNYTEIKTAAQTYSDRYDDEVTNNMDTFLTMTESRISRNLRVGQMVKRATLSTTEDQAYYIFPSDYLGLRDIQLETKTLEYLDPGAMNDTSNYSDTVFYTLIDNQIQLAPPPPSGKTLEIVYYASIPSIKDNTTNWLGDAYPDIYLAGLLFEIYAYVQNKDAALTWNQRFEGLINELNEADRSDRWSGTPLQVRVK